MLRWWLIDGDRSVGIVTTSIDINTYQCTDGHVQVLVVNTHLLFPHNPYSSRIRLREVQKVRCMLGYICVCMCVIYGREIVRRTRQLIYTPISAHQ